MGVCCERSAVWAEGSLRGCFWAWSDTLSLLGSVGELPPDASHSRARAPRAGARPRGFRATFSTRDCSGCGKPPAVWPLAIDLLRSATAAGLPDGGRRRGDFMGDNHYDTLRIQPTATSSEIRRAFRRVAAEWHPEKWAEREPALGDAMFRAAAEAYVALSASVSSGDPHGSDPAGLAPESERSPGRSSPSEGVKAASGGPALPSEDPEGAISTSRASEIFLSEMTLFAKELFAEGVDAEGVGNYLVSFGCPTGLVWQAVHAAQPPAAPASRRVGSASGVPPWPTLEPMFVTYLTGRAELRRMEDSSFARLVRRHRASEIVFLVILAGIAVPAVGAAFVRLPAWLTLTIPIALSCAVIGWLLFSVVHAHRHPGFRLERKLRLDLAAMREIAHRRHFSLSEFSLEAALGGPVWAALHRMPRLAVGWVLAAAMLDVVLLATGQRAVLVVPVWALASLGFGVVAARLRFRAGLAAFAACAEAGHASDPGGNGVQACIAHRGGTRTLQAIGVVLSVFALILANVSIVERIRQVPTPTPALTPTTPGPMWSVDRSPAAVARDSEDEEDVRSRQQRQEAARQFNALMAEFEKRHPEFDNRSPRHNPAATESLARRIAILEGQGLDSLEALRRAMQEYERLLASRPQRGVDPDPPKSGPVAPPPLPAVDDDALRTLCETFPHACRR